LTDGHDGAVLVHTDDGVVSAVGYIKVRAFVQSGITGEIGVVGFEDCRSQVNRFVEDLGPDMADTRYTKDYPAADDVEDRDPILERLTDKQCHGGSPIQENADAWGDTVVFLILILSVFVEVMAN
jgi:hypothetical protein